MGRLSFDAAEHLAQKFRIDNGLSVAGMIDVVSILRQLNIFTAFRPLSETFYGMSLQSKSGLKFMLINSENPIGRQHFSIAHELYHLFYDENPEPHICQNEGESKASETKANAFAAALLMPYEALVSYIPVQEIKEKKLTVATILRLEQYFRVSRQALLIRLKAGEFISAAEYSSLSAFPIADLAKEYGYNTALYYKGNKNLVIGDFGERARVLYEKEQISEGHYLELLNLITYDQD